MKPLLFIILVLFQTRTFAFDYVKYNSLINKAEIAITENKFDYALTTYDSAFSMKKIPFARDLFNASLCAIYLKNNDRAMNYCKQLVIKGVGSDFFTKNDDYLPLHSRSDWKNTVAQAKKARESMLAATKNLRATVDGLLSAYNKNKDWWKRRDIGLEEKSNIKLTQDSILLKFYELLDKHDFLNENVIGPSLNKDGRLMENPVFQNILSADRKIADSLYAPALTAAFKNGNLRAVYYVNTLSWIARELNNNYGIGLFKNYQCTIYTPKNALKDSSQVNQQRSAIGFESLNDELKKIAYWIANPKSPVHFGTRVLIVMNIGKEFSEMVNLDENIIIVDQVPGCRS